MKLNDIQYFIEKFEIALSNYKGAKLVKEYYTYFSYKNKIIDAVLTVNSKPLAAFEFKNYLSNDNKQQILHLIADLQINCKFMIITNGKTSIVIDTYSNVFTELFSIDSILQMLFKKQEKVKFQPELIENKIQQNLFALQSRFKEMLSGKVNFKRLEDVNDLISRFTSQDLVDNLQYDTDGQFYFLNGDIRDLNSFENSLFTHFVKEASSSAKIFRYTSLDSIFKTIQNKKIRLNGIVGMNDISEIGYVEEYFDKGYKPMSDDFAIDSVNKKFILCSSKLEDELMQWRLYGDDCKGGCLCLEVKKHHPLPGLLLREISYGIEVNGENFHPELEVIKIVKTILEEILCCEFKFKSLAIWKHFFKSFEYTAENEVRLLLIGNNQNEIKGERYLNGIGNPIGVEWNLTNSHQILAPFLYVDIHDNRLPFVFKSLILGSKCPEAVINVKQFKYLLSKQGLSGIDVKLSKINNYR